MKEESNLKQKQKYLQTEIVEKNCDTLEFINFMKKKCGEEINLNNYTLETLKDYVHEFKTGQSQEQILEQLHIKKEEFQNEFLVVSKQLILGFEEEFEQSNKDINEKLIDNEDNNNMTQSTIFSNSNLIDDKYKDNNYMEISTENLNFDVNDPKYKSPYHCFFLPKQCSYKIHNNNNEVERSIDDFLWLESKLNYCYPGIFVPPIQRSLNTKDNSQSTVQMLNNFLNAVVERKIFCSSILFKDFVSLSLDLFTLKKKKVDEDNTQYINPIKKDVIKKIKEISKNNKTNVSNIQQNLNKKSQNLEELNKALFEFVNEFSIFKEKINKLTNALKKCKESFSKDVIIETSLIKIEEKSEKWSSDIETLKKSFNDNLLNLFDYINKEYKAYDILIQKHNFAYDDYKKTSKNDSKYKDFKNRYKFYNVMVNEEYSNLIKRQTLRIEKHIKLLEDTCQNSNLFT